MTIYILFYIVVLLLCMIETNYKYIKIGVRLDTKKVSIFIIAVFLLAIGLLCAEELGGDSLNYKYSYWTPISKLSISDALSYDRDWGFSLFIWIVSKFTSKFIVFRKILYIIASFSLIFWVRKYSKNVALSFLFFLSFNYLGLLLCLYRMALAVAIAIWGYEFAVKRKFIPYIILTLLASTFHKTAIVLLIFYPMIYKKVKCDRIIKNGIWILFAAIMMFLAPYIATIYTRNDYSKDLGTGGYALLLLLIVMYIYIHIYIRNLNIETPINIKKVEKKNNQYRNSLETKTELVLGDVYELSKSAIYIQIIALGVSIATRMLFFSVPFLPIIISEIFQLQNDKRERNSLLFGIMIILTILFIRNIISDGYQIVPYISIFE